MKSKWRRLTLRHFFLLAEALLVLSMAKLLGKIVPFRVLARALRHVSCGSAAALTAEQLTQLKEIRWALTAIGRRVGVLQQCLYQGIAARWMLSRRHIANTLLFGVQKSEHGQLLAHAWVRASGRTVVGGESAADYRVIATFGEAQN